MQGKQEKHSTAGLSRQLTKCHLHHKHTISCDNSEKNPLACLSMFLFLNERDKVISTTERGWHLVESPRQRTVPLGIVPGHSLHRLKLGPVSLNVSRKLAEDLRREECELLRTRDLSVPESSNPVTSGEIPAYGIYLEMNPTVVPMEFSGYLQTSLQIVYLFVFMAFSMAS